MAAQNESSLAVSWPGIVAFLVAVAGMIFSRQPVQSLRPAPAAGGTQVKTVDSSAPARLWQDPLAAAQHGAQPGGEFAAIGKNCPPAGDSQKTSKPALFLFVCVDPSDEPEAAELRRRERYDAFSALSTAGYAPAHPDRIYYASLGAGRADNSGQKKRLEKWRSDLRIPYEWLQQESADDQGNKRFQAVCLLWLGLPSDAVSQREFMRALQERLQHQCANSKFAINGRIDSSQLRELLQEKTNEVACDEPTKVYVTNSTALSVRSLAVPDSLKLEYIIDTDMRLAEELINEVIRRGINPKEKGRMAIIAEWDTEYGREMHALFDEAVNSAPPADTNGATSTKPPQVIKHYSYLRGLDGKELSSSPADKPPSQPQSEPETAGAEKSAPPDSKPSARQGEGQSQVDYVRRLADLMKAEQPKEGQGSSIQAIGIVGSDVYDKLLLLRALKPAFPNALFFTTDLDVRLLQPAEYADTRNLVIASHYGLSLIPELQGKVPPFRSTYDTASYIGYLRAVDFPMRQTGQEQSVVETVLVEQCTSRLLVPSGTSQPRMPVRLYEIARSGAYELTLRTDDPLEPKNARLSPWLLQERRPIYLLAVVLVMGVLLYPVSRPWQRILHSTFLSLTSRFPRAGKQTQVKATGDRIGIIAGIGIAVISAGLIIAIYIAHTTNDNEAFELFEGISIWPTVLLRFVSCIFCVYYIRRTLGALARRNEEIVAEFSFVREPNTSPPVAASSWREVLESCRGWTQDPAGVQDVGRLFWGFADYGAPRRRWHRTLVLAAFNVLLFILLWLLFNPSVIQARGYIARNCFLFVLVLTLLSLATLLMFVADATLLPYRFVTALTNQRNRIWPAKAMADALGRWGLAPQAGNAEGPQSDGAIISAAVSQWLFIRLIDLLTYVVASRLIYYPFVVLLLLVVAQNPLFDDWHFNTPLSLMALFSAGVAIACAVLLQYAAKRAKKQAIDVIDDLIHTRPVLTRDPVRKKLSEIRAEIDDYNSGAFASLYQNHLVRAVLLPLFGGGGLAAVEAGLDYLARP